MKKYLAFLFLVFSVNAFGASSMKRCTVLPIIDEVNGAIGNKVFTEIEKILKSNQVCTYVSNSGLLSVFSKYKSNLSLYLKNSKIISTVAEKLKIGSVFKIDLLSEINGMNIILNIYGENGEDLYFSEQLSLKNNQVDSIVEVLNNWIEIYSKSIPYDGLVIGVLGEQITIDIGKNFLVKPGNKVILKRLKSKKLHPLFKKIVDWDTEVLGEGVVESVSDSQALVRVTSKYKEKKLVNGDWARIDNSVDIFKKNEKPSRRVIETPGVLGEAQLDLFVTSTSLDRNVNDKSGRMSGNIFGVELKGEAWITRNYFAKLELLRGLGSLKKAQGEIEKDNISTNILGYKILGGYKYLPTGFFFGPKLDFFGGIAKVTYDSNISSADGFGRHSFSGLLIGVSGELPLNRKYRIFTQLETIPLPSFEDDSALFKKASSVIFLDIEFGLKYTLTQNININGSIEATSRKAKFSGSYKEISYKDTMLKVGTSLNF